jgi:hypothetical protein
VRQTRERAHVDIDHCFDAFPFAFLEQTVIANAGIVDQEIHVLTTRRERFKEGLGLHFIGQIGGVAMDREFRSRDLGLQLFEPLAPPRDENEGLHVRRELTRKLAPEPG